MEADIGFRTNILTLFKHGTWHQIELSQKRALWEFFETAELVDFKSGLYFDLYTIPTCSTIELSDAAKASLMVDNAGGNSAYSEAISIQYFLDVFQATDIVYEMNVKYYINYKMIDFLCTLGQQRIGVSVTRAMTCPQILLTDRNNIMAPVHGPRKKSQEDFTIDDGLKLLKKKIYGLVIARNAVIKEQRFYKSVLHIFCQTQAIATKLKLAYEMFKQDADLNNFNVDIGCHVIILLTVCVNPDIYRNRAFYVYKRKHNF